MTEESCVICLEDMHETFKGGPTKLHCGHSFCKYCIEAWFRVNKKCPMCRAKGQILPSGSMPLRGIRRICPTPGNSSDDDHSEVVRCPIDYCYSRIQSRNFDAHMTRCHRLVPCPACEEVMMKHLIKRHRERDCVHRLVHCPGAGCPQFILYSMLLQLEMDCESREPLVAARLREHHLCGGPNCSRCGEAFLTRESFHNHSCDT
jgi:hypothetical protein